MSDAKKTAMRVFVQLQHNIVDFPTKWLKMFGASSSEYHANMPVKCSPPYTPFLDSKTGCIGKYKYFLIFALKQTLWVRVRTASMRRF